MAKELKTKIQEISRPEDYLEAMCDFVILVAQAMPDLYTEALWKSVCLSLRSAIEQDFMPFLAVVSSDFLSKTL